MNPYAPSSIANADAAGVTQPQIVRTILTGACAVVFTLTVWVVLVTLLDRPFRAYENIVWSGTLWFSAMLCSGFVAYSRHSKRPVLGCTIAFGVFGLTYMICEGPIFGNVSAGGDPSMTQFVVWNLACLPFGVFTATEIGSWLGHRRRKKSRRTMNCTCGLARSD